MAEYIKREDALRRTVFVHGRWDDTYLSATQLKAIPAADVAPVVHGRWLDGRCTVCGWEEPDEIGYDGYEFSPWGHTNYCPNCGAKMDGGR